MANKEKIPAILVGRGLPNFIEITPEEISEHVPSLLKTLNEELNHLENSLDNKLKGTQILTWNEVMTPLDEISEKLRWTWGVISHLNGVCNSSELRRTYACQQPEVIRFGNKLGQSRIIYNSLLELKNKKHKELDETQLRIIETELLSMSHRGIGLNGEDKKVFNETSEKLAELSNTFSNHVLDATKSWGLVLTKPSEVEGLPSRVLKNLASSGEVTARTSPKDSYRDKKDNGPWKISLDMPTYLAFMAHAKNRSLREVVYKAQVSKASSGTFNNREIIEEILTLRKKQANLLGYKSWADLSLASKMAKDVNEVENLIEELRAAAMPIAEKELKELKECANRKGAPEANNLAPWDIPYWSEQLRQEKFNLNQEALREWFPLPKVLDGLFQLCEKLFDIKIIDANHENIPKWHPDVSFFNVLDKSETQIASFYLDPYSRSETKRGGAWMDECLTRRKVDDGSDILPVAYLICNQTPPTEETPSLMSFEEVETLFHEFGHGLQHMLTQIDYPQAAGINNVEWDAVELPSQFMENWCLDHSTILGIAKHWETGEELPQKEFNNLQLSRTFNSGMATLRQIHFALTDLRLHDKWECDMGITPDKFRREIAKTTTVLNPIEEDQFLCSFSHIFAGGYAAGYYSYKWAEVLSADAFSAFEEVGLEKDEEIREIGKLFRDTILSLGGSRSPSEIFKEFRGRPPSTKALIRHLGLHLST